MKEFPAIKLAILFTAGILLTKFYQIGIPVSIVLILITTLTFILNTKLRSSSLHLFNLLLVSICVLAFGNVTAQVNHPYYHLLPENIYKVKDVKVIGEIKSIELERKGVVVFNIESKSVSLKDSLVNNKIAFICKVSDKKSKLDSLYNNIKIGNVIYFTGNYSKGNEERNPGEFDYNKYLRSKGISGILSAYKVSDITIVNKDKNIYANTIFNIRKEIFHQINKLYNEESSGLLKGLLLADRSDISYDTKSEFINSGVIHILAVSGLHVGFIILIFTFLFGRFNVYTRSIMTIAGLTCYLILIGPPPSAFRAGVMAVVLIIAFLTNRSTNLINSVAIAAFIILLIQPYDIYTAGFQLSFSAVISIAIFYPPISEAIKKLEVRNNIVKNVFLFAGVSIAAQIGTLPVTIYYFGKLSLIALFTNLIVIPLVGVIVGIGILSLVLAAVVPSIALYFSVVNELIIKFIFLVIHITGSSDYSFMRIRSFSIYDIVIFYALLFVLFVFYRKFNRISAKLVLIILCFINFYLFTSLDNKELLPQGKLSVVMIDVGQGDAFLLKFPDGETALIDAGEATINYDNGERVILPLMNYLGIDKIDYGLVSHIDLDHYGGFVSLIHNGKISKIYKPEMDSSEAKDVRFEKYIHDNNIPGQHYKKEIIKIGNARIYVLNTEDYNATSSNNRSGLLKVVYGNSEFLFTGDLEKQGEDYYSKMYGTFLDSDVLKVCHHGSKTSSSEEFLNLVTPEISLISDGILNKFHHPSQITIDKLKTIRSKIYRTDLSGAIIIQTDGDNIKKVNWREL